MKTIFKVFVVVLSMMFISGCSNEERYNGVEFEYNGHSYIEFRHYTGNNYWIVGTVHNPDCKCYNVE